MDERQTQTANTLTQTRMRSGNADSNARKSRRFQSLEQCYYPLITNIYSSFSPVRVDTSPENHWIGLESANYTYFVYLGEKEGTIELICICTMDHLLEKSAIQIIYYLSKTAV